MLNRRQVLQLFPLSLVLGAPFLRREAITNETAEEVAVRLFRAAQRGDWSRLLDVMPDKVVNQLRRSLESTADVPGADSIGKMMDAVPAEPAPFPELRDALGKLDELVESAKSGSNADKLAVEGDPIKEVRQVLEVAGPIARFDVPSDRDFMMAYLRGFEPFLAQLAETDLTIVGSVPAGGERIHVIYRLSGVLALRPSVISLSYSEAGWCAVGGDQLTLVAQLSVSERMLPALKFRILGELTEAGLTHFVCEADCWLGTDFFRPSFCCTWFTRDPDVANMRAQGYEPLIRILQHDIEASCKQAIELACKNE